MQTTLNPVIPAKAGMTMDKIALEIFHKL